jgi:Tfp pilus assembly protein PilN
MINLLPSEQIVAVKSEYRRRRLTVFEVFVLAWLLILTLFISSLYILALAERQAAVDQLATKQKMLAVTGAGGLSAQLVQLTNDLQTIKTAEQTRILPFGFFQKILAAKPTGVKIDHLFFAKGVEVNGESIIELAGLAGNRRALLIFLEQLRGDRTFSAVDSPVSNLIKESNVDFNLKLHLNQSS